MIVVGTAALIAASGASAALAQTAAGPTLSVVVKPAKAGTKKKPKNSSIKLTVVNNDQQRTLSKLTITIPKTLTLSGKGFKSCSEAKLNADGPSGCPRASKVGGGSADALVGVNAPPGNQAPLHFDVTAVVGGKSAINFYLHAGGVNVVAPGRVRSNKLTVTVPINAQQPAPGTWAGLIKFQTLLKGKAPHNRFLIASTGCKAGAQKFKAALTFANNGVSPAGTTTVSGESPCTK